MKSKHESFGMLDIAKFNGSSDFFGSDLNHNGGVYITISLGERERKLNSEWYYSGRQLVRVRLSHNQFVDAITSGMNTSGVPCTIEYIEGKKIEQISHIEDKRENFRNDMSSTQENLKKRIDEILSKMEGTMGVRKSNEIKHDLEILKNHISSNTNFVMTCFNEAMEDTVTEAKHSISNYIDHKVHSLGLDGLRKELNVSIDKE